MCGTKISFVLGKLVVLNRDQDDDAVGAHLTGMGRKPRAANRYIKFP
jgi:hypothetical protein